MWYEVLPGMVIIFGVLALPHKLSPVMNTLLVGNYFRRDVGSETTLKNYLRDKRVGNGDPYHVNGLETIPDADDDDDICLRDIKDKK